jgi:hypothetical protein
MWVWTASIHSYGSVWDSCMWVSAVCIYSCMLVWETLPSTIECGFEVCQLCADIRCIIIHAYMWVEKWVSIYRSNMQMQETFNNSHSSGPKNKKCKITHLIYCHVDSESEHKIVTLGVESQVYTGGHRHFTNINPFWNSNSTFDNSRL